MMSKSTFKNLSRELYHKSLLALIKESSHGIIIRNHEQKIIQINQTFSKLTGFGVRTLKNETWPLYPKIEEALLQKSYWKGIKTYPHRHQQTIDIPVEIIRIHDLENVIDIEITRVGLIHKINQKGLWKLAFLDRLTHLPNRYLLEDTLEKNIRNKNKVAFMYIDLDHFKEVNDAFSHDVGDFLLKKVAKRIRDFLPKEITVGRIEGDEFGIILENNPLIKKIADELLNLLRQPFVIKTHSIYISASIGISCYPDNGKKVKDIISHADEAMYVAKANGKNQYSFYKPIEHFETFETVLLIHDLKQGMLRNQFEIFFQPIMNFKTKTIDKAEALLRWHHPDKGLLTPLTFLPFIQRTDLLLELDNWVFMEVCRKLCKWQITYPQLQISINTPALLFEYPHAQFNYWKQTLEEKGLSPNKIILEITEATLFKPNSRAISQIRFLQEQGLQIALDDFGTGYASLEYLKKIKAQYLKINHIFIKDIHEQHSNQILCKTIIKMAHALSIQVIAEDISSIEQLQHLKKFNADYGQGYAISTPISALALEKLLNNQKK